MSEPVNPEKSVEQEVPEIRYSKAWWLRFWREQIRPLAVLLIALFSVRSAIADWNVVPTGSMKPTIIEGDRIFVNKLAYDLKIPFTTIHLAKWSDPKRGEIVVFDSPKDGTRLVKRVVAVPGDTVQLDRNVLIVNGSPAQYGKLDQDTIDQLIAQERGAHGFAVESVGDVKHAVMSTPSIEGAMRSYGPVTVPQGRYFMLGDNRDNSADSRYIGFVPRNNIVGRSSRVILSLNYDNYYLPRSQRWFRALP
jgi:signal peptidase I